MPYELTRKQILKEIIRCGKDSVYFINNYCKISHPLEGLIPFKTYDFQDDLLRHFDDYRFNIILKARQLGISTITAGYIVWLMLFHRDKNVLVIATKFGTASNLVKKVKHILKSLPHWIQISKVIIDNRSSFELDNGSQIKASSTSPDAGRSEALSLLVIDEAAHVEGLEELWTGLYPTLSTGGRCIALSTPNGVGNWFHKAYIDSESKKNDFHYIKLLWDVHPARDQEWFEKETLNMSSRQVAQELLCNFNASGETVIHSKDIDRILKGVKEPTHRVGFDRNFWIWEEYNPENTYLLAADVARGDGKDYSVFHVFKLETMEIIAEYQGKLPPDMFAMVLLNAGKEYGNCMIIVENNTIGYSVLDKLKELQYPNIFYSIKSTHEYIDSYEAETKSNAIAGFTMSSKTRPLVVAKLEEFIRNKLLIIYSKRLQSELTTFVWNNGKPEAMRSYNDDLIMSCAIGCWVRDTAIIENQKDLAYKKAMLDGIMTSKTHLDTKISGMSRTLTDISKEEVAKYSQYSWLLKG